MSRIGRERGWPPLTRAQFDPGAARAAISWSARPDEAIAKILAQHELFGHDRFLMQFRSARSRRTRSCARSSSRRRWSRRRCGRHWRSGKRRLDADGGSERASGRAEGHALALRKSEIRAIPFSTRRISASQPLRDAPRRAGDRSDSIPSAPRIDLGRGPRLRLPLTMLRMVPPPPLRRGG